MAVVVLPDVAPAGAAAGPSLPRARPRVAALVELVVVATLYAAYAGSRVLSASAPADAMQNAYSLLHLQGLLQLPSAQGFNEWFSSVPALAVPADYVYATLHYVVTPAVLVWLWCRHRAVYGRARTALLWMTVLGVVGFTLYPLAPPRLLPGFTDTMAAFSGYGWWGAAASAPEHLAGWTNQYAAMPSLHVGWAVWSGWLVLRHATRAWLRVLGVAYPLVISVVVVGTANHYVLDVLAGVLLAMLAIASCDGASRLVRRRRAVA